MVSNALLTSKNQEWETPHNFFEKLNKILSFTVDACANDKNAKLERYWSPETDGLAQSWEGERVWMNPPYQNKSPKQIDWVRKAYTEVKDNGCQLAACLLPARTDTKLFHNYVMKSTAIYFVCGRLRFVDAAASAVFPSMVVLFERSTYTLYPLGHQPTFGTMDAKGNILT